MINEIQRFITKVAEGKHLSQEETSRAFQIIMNGGATPAQIASLLTALHIKGETPEEITGAALVMRAKMEKITAPDNAIDVCGTGGDHKGSLNVSTAVALVVAACGLPVVKHGNKSVSSLSGSADILAELGVNIQADKAKVEASLSNANICFMYAPLYHKAMRHVAPVRQELGFRTLFNLLGPLVNPAQPTYQLMGVYDKDLLEPLAKVLRLLGSTNAWVVHGSDGIDELTLSGVSHVAELKNGEIRLFDITPEEAGLERAEPDAIAGKSPAYNARELSLLLTGKQSPYRDIVLYNSAAALLIAGKVENLLAGVMLAKEVIDSGKAKEALAKLMYETNLL
jgi:anthranilate phosphoribosyltransferase